ncbi:MAG: electron transfer flavoprotein subunit beta/FixA family protein [Natronomonas sp.]|jgi:electron transfer flavoprotein beta subunit|uniref:Electron transfer flavoprotein subunit beta/FixA family protein n=1 Tax=Natronomonas salsuginis TaxID=2217661 RepID=A0A4U5J600_9EURY|nr:MULTISPECIES: electron transfer flavoprotein subunit beta/FixA family protein [Natronomonas]MDR9429701.1 electron transfer flavoprotein subunit beta/FixA family protein [Natronomonas sp.]TKR24390.1 electron transfer flavoprotein subunit beta/FixA family protein [Natronomonas salsuginis]
MKILVTVKEVAEVDDEFEISGLDIAEGSLDYDLNEWDDYAVEEAVQISEETDDVEVITVTIGPERAEETVRMALAKGADRAIRVWDDALDEAQFLDVSAKADIIAAVAEEEEPDLVLSGVQAGDDSNGATGVAVAERLDFEWAAVVNDLDLDAEAGQAAVHRELEGGIEELTDVDIPAVLTIQTGINEPRYASLRGIRQAQRKPLDAKTLADVGLDESVVDSPVERTSMYEPESESDAVVWEGSPEETASELAAFLRDKGVVEG